MTTFQAIVYAIVHGFTQFLPLSAEAHQRLIPYFFEWPPVEGYFAGALSLAGFLALLVYFRHDWASMISSFLQVILFRKKPMTLDERLPLFIGITLLPPALAWYYLQERIQAISWHPLLLAGILAGGAVALVFFDSFSRKNRGMSDWTWFDTVVIGILQALALIPGIGIQSGGLVAALARNFNREAVAKFIFFVITPMIGASAFYQLRGFTFQVNEPTTGMSWLSFVTAFIVTFFVSLLAIGGFTRAFQKRGVGQYGTYRWLLAIATGAVFWLRNRG